MIIYMEGGEDAYGHVLGRSRYDPSFAMHTRVHEGNNEAASTRLFFLGCLLFFLL